MFNRIKIAQKIYFLGLSLLCITLVVGLIGFTQMQKIGNEIVDIAEIDIPLNNVMTHITEHQLMQVIELERAVLNGVLDQYAGGNFEKEMAHHIKEVRDISKEIKHEFVEAEALIEKAFNIAHSQVVIDKLSDLKETILLIDSHFVKTEHETFELVDLLEANKIEDALKFLPTLEKHQNELDEELIEVLNDIQAFTAASALQAEHDEINALKLITLVIIGAVILAILLPILIGRSITGPIGYLQNRLEEITKGDGDLTLRINSPMKDEIGAVSNTFDLFIDQLASTVRKITNSSLALESSSSTALRITEETQQSIKTQQDETTSVANAVSEMNVSTQEVAQSTTSAAQMAEKVKMSVEIGKRSADDTQVIIRDMADEIIRTSKDIETLAKETESIGTVLNAIQGIAEQTNLLALNAAIEAARAGESGRGFAVVADEVRSLAQRTQSSTVDIKELVEKLQKEATQAVASMQNGNQKTEACLVKSTETSQAFEEAYDAVSSISDLNIQIATAVEEQSHVSVEISNNLQNIQSIALSTTEGAEKTAVANEQIASQIIELNNSIHQFKA
ncbi:methyl-accepting chemotaxis protein [Marinomonas sp. PE14-40]|uniref:methyl-accepting chemotaxis protein n=1 Tax=Marinomonas sp. PE14-40 TaxID=3060621 RepID=UPI003F669ABA